MNLGDIGLGAIGLARAFRQIGHVAAQDGDDLIDAFRVARADIHDLARHFALHRHDEGVDDIADKGEIAGLAAVADHGQRLAGELLREEHAEHGAVGTGGAGARAEDVEGAQAVAWQAVGAAPMHDILLAEIFRQRVRVHGADFGGLRRGKFIRQAITRRGRHIDQPLHPGLTRRFKRGDGAVDVGMVIAQRMLDAGHHIGERGDMEHPIDILEMGRRIGVIGDIHLVKAERGIVAASVEIFRPAGGEIVEDGDIMAVAEQSVGNVTADESGAAGNETFHVSGALLLHTRISYLPQGRLRKMSGFSIKIT